MLTTLTLEKMRTGFLLHYLWFSIDFELDKNKEQVSLELQQSIYQDMHIVYISIVRTALWCISWITSRISKIHDLKKYENAQ